MRRSHTSRAVTLAVASVLTGMLVLVVAACGGSDETPAQLASLALSAGLKAHAEGNYEEAIKQYQEALVHDPKNKFAFYNLGLIAQTQARNDEAISNYEQALSVDPAFVPALFNLAIIRTQEGDTHGAISLYRRAIRSDPSYAAAHLNLGFLLIDTGQQGKGRQELVLAVQLDPSLSSRIPPEDLVSPGVEPSGSPSLTTPSATPSP